MSQNRFCMLTRTLTEIPSHRDVPRGLAGTGLGFSLAWERTVAVALAAQARPEQELNALAAATSGCRTPARALCTTVAPLGLDYRLGAAHQDLKGGSATLR